MKMIKNFNEVGTHVLHELLGKTLTHVINEDNDPLSEAELLFRTTEDRYFILRNGGGPISGWCNLDILEGELSDLVSSPILQAEICIGEPEYIQNEDIVGRWMFLKLATIKGYVNITFRGYATDFFYWSHMSLYEELDKKSQESLIPRYVSQTSGKIYWNEKDVPKDEWAVVNWIG